MRGLTSTALVLRSGLLVPTAEKTDRKRLSRNASVKLGRVVNYCNSTRKASPDSIMASKIVYRRNSLWELCSVVFGWLTHDPIWVQESKV
jgi:hypothetical protein